MILIFMYQLAYHLVQIINPHDATILYNKIYDLQNKHLLLFNKNKTLIVDVAFES